MAKAKKTTEPEVKIETLIIEESIPEVAEEKSPEVKDIILEEPVSVEPEAMLPILKAEPPVIKKQITKEEAIVDFVKTRSNGSWIKINDFIRSLYPLRRPGDAEPWLEMGENKRIKLMLCQLVEAGEVEISQNRHQQLGKGFYVEPDMKLQHYNINNLILEAKK